MEINYKANPTATRFHKSNKICRGLMGPVGNGKSVACITEGLRLSADQWPNAQGARKSRGVIVRNTSIELRTTTLQTWKAWVPELICPIITSPMISGTMIQPLKDGTTIELEIWFLALDKEKDVKKLLSLETTWVFLNEARELPYAVVKAARERIGRYPSQAEGYQDTSDYKAPRGDDGHYKPCKRKALLMDTNPPDTDHWWYELAEVGHLKGSRNKDFDKSETRRVFDFFRGPPPLIKHDDGHYEPNPDAENIEHLDGGYDYYLDMIAGNTEDHINVMVLGNYGAIMEGRPVYPAYRDHIHSPQGDFAVAQSLEVCMGWDFGLTPAVIFGQMTDLGQIRIFAELCAEDMDVYQFARDVVKPWINKNLRGFKLGFSLGDPAGNNRGEGEGKTSIGILNDEYCIDGNGNQIMEPLDLGFVTEAAPTNDPTRRISAVTTPMLRLLPNGEPGYVLNRECPMLRKGKLGGYCYKRVQVSGEARYRDKPDKGKYSHPADAEQYLCLGFQQGISGTSEDEYDDYDDDYREAGAMGY